MSGNCYSVLAPRVFYAYLSGSHATLPLAELRAILEALGASYCLLEVHDQLVLFEANMDPRLVVERAGFIHEVGVALAVAEAEEECIARAFSAISWPEVVRDEKFRIHIERVRGYARHLAKLSAPKLARIVLERYPMLKPDPRHASKVVRVIVTEGIAVIGVRLAVLDTKSLMSRKPQLRPFFKPGSLDPRLCRVFVNLSRPPASGVYLDPFCGTGGFAVEATTMSLHTVLCSELARDLVEGSLININYYDGAIGSSVHADAVFMPYRDESVDAIGTDPPYGRSSSTRGRRLMDLLKGFLAEAYRVLKPCRYICFAIPHWVNPRRLVEEAGLELVEYHYMRVHGSLTRILVVARKPCRG